MQLINNSQQLHEKENPLSSNSNQSMTILSNRNSNSNNYYNHHNNNDNASLQTNPSLSPSHLINLCRCSIEEIESMFTLRQFENALLYANEILYHAKTNSSNSSSSKLSKQKESLQQQLLFDIPMFYYPTIHQENSNFDDNDGCNNYHSFRFFKLGIHNNINNNNSNSYYDDIDDSIFTTSLSPSIQDRAATIAIQSSYELWKERNQERQQTNNICTPSCCNSSIQEQQLDSTLQEHLHPFLSLYTDTNSTTTTTTTTTTSTTTKTSTATISFDVLFTWVQFIYTIGLHSTCIEMILHFIDVVFLSIDDDDYYDYDCNDDDDGYDGIYFMNDNHNGLDEMNTTQDSIVQILEHKFDSPNFSQHQLNNNKNSNETCHCHHHHHHQQQHHDLYNDHEYNDKHSIYNQCYYLFRFLLVDILPGIQDKDILENITTELCILMTKRIFHHDHNYNNNNSSHGNYKPYLKGMMMKKQHPTNDIQLVSSTTINKTKPLLSSVTKVHQTIESILNYTKDTMISVHYNSNHNNTNTTCTSMKLIPYYVKECLEECLNDICMLQEEIQFINGTINEDTCILHPNDSNNNDKKQNLNTIMNKISNYITNQNLDEEEEENCTNSNNDTLKDDKSSSSIIINNYILEPLWTSEKRWINRGKVLAVGYVTYSMFKKKKRREQIMNMSKQVANVFVSPLKEIISAFKD